MNISDDLETSAQRDQLKQAFINLIDNACEAIKEQEDSWLEVSGQEVDDKIVLTIQDSGLGIESDIVDNIFDPFFTSRETGFGKGLGLPITKALIEINNGKLRYLKEENTTFEVTLPLARS